MGVLLSLSPNLLGLVVVTSCLVAFILSMAILVFVYKAKTNINLNLGLGSLIFTVLADENIKNLIELIKSFLSF